MNLAGQGQSWKVIDCSMPRRWNTTRHPVHLGAAGRSASISTAEHRAGRIAARPHLLSKGAIDMSSGDWNFWLDAGGTTSCRNRWSCPSHSRWTLGNANRYTLHEMNLSQVADAHICRRILRSSTAQSGEPRSLPDQVPRGRAPTSPVEQARRRQLPCDGPAPRERMRSSTGIGNQRRLDEQ